MELLDPTIDFIFKKIFGDNKECLISLLNAILNGNPVIKDVEILNTNVDKVFMDEKASRLDIKALTNKDTLVNIEIQRRDTGDIESRALYYLSHLIIDATKAGTSYNRGSAISIWIMKENLKQGEISKRATPVEEILLCAKPSEMNNYYTEYSNKGRIFMVFLDKFQEKYKYNKQLYNWVQFLTTPDTTIEGKDKEVDMAVDILEKVSSDNKTRYYIQSLEDYKRDKASEYDTGRQRGLLEGIKQGILEEKERNNLKLRQTIINMRNKGLDTSTISECLGIDIDEISNLMQ